MPALININQKLVTQYELMPEKTELDNENKDWPSNKTKYVFWAQEKLNFRVVNSKLLVDSPLKKELLEAWTTPEWYQKNTVEDMESRMEVDMDSPYLYGNKLDLDLDVLGKFFLERLEVIKNKKLEMLEKDTFLEDFVDSFEKEDINWPIKLKPIADRMKLALERIRKDKDCTLHKCPTCGIYSKANNNYSLGFSYDSNPNSYPGTWKDLDYYIYRIMSNINVNAFGQNRCWLCEMCRETWENKAVEDKIKELNDIEVKIYQKGTVFMDCPGSNYGSNIPIETPNMDDPINCGYYMGDEMCPSGNI